MAEKFLTGRNPDGTPSGGIGEREALVTSAGSGSAGRVPALDGSGLLDTSLMPTGVGPAMEPVTASEDLAAGDLVNFHVVTGAARARKADASSNKPADGFVLVAVTSGQTAQVYRSGRDTAVTGRTVGDQYLSTTPGASTSTVPTPSSGGIVQRVGFATAATSLSFARGVPLQVA